MRSRGALGFRQRLLGTPANPPQYSRPLGDTEAFSCECLHASHKDDLVSIHPPFAMAMMTALVHVDDLTGQPRLRRLCPPCEKVHGKGDGWEWS